MTRRRLLLVGVLACVVGMPFVGHWARTLAPGVTEENFTRLHVGMTLAEIETIMGRPGTNCSEWDAFTLGSVLQISLGYICRWSHLTNGFLVEAINVRHRHDLPWEEWKRIASFFPHRVHGGHRGRPFENHYRIFNGILWRLHTGAPWRDIPDYFGPWETLYGRFRRWRRDGTWASILTCLLADLEQRGRLGHDLWLVDATVVRASRAAAGAQKHPREIPHLAGDSSAQLEEPEEHALGYSRGGFGTKVHLLVTDRGIVLGIYVTPGQQHESTAFKPLLRRVLLVRHHGTPYWPAKLAADKGYSYPHIRRWTRQHHIEPVIPTRTNQPKEESFDKASYRKRNRIERVVGHYKECRALGTRYEKLAIDYVALWMVAVIEKLLHLG